MQRVIVSRSAERRQTPEHCQRPGLVPDRQVEVVCGQLGDDGETSNLLAVECKTQTGTYE
jgi:hypothetical protein